jgi:hypothetical protein
MLAIPHFLPLELSMMALGLPIAENFGLEKIGGAA